MEAWLLRRIRGHFSYWLSRAEPEQLIETVIRETVEDISRYRSGEDPEQYRAFIQEQTNLRVQRYNETGE